MQITRKLFSFLAANFLCLVYCATAAAQPYYDGVVVDEKDNQPIPYASLSIDNKKKGILADSHGRFKLSEAEIKGTDTIQVSSVGYQTLKIVLSEARRKPVLTLSGSNSQMENVTLKAYQKEAVEGNKLDVNGYFYSWPTKGTGAEIGRIFDIQYDDYLVDKIRFKVNNQCDVCQIRLRIRSVKNGYPDNLLVLDSIAMPIKKLSFDDKYSEFDLSSRKIILKEKQVFVSLEVMQCSGQPCSFCFIGTEPGTYMTKKNETDDWKENNDHNIYLKFYYKHK